MEVYFGFGSKLVGHVFPKTVVRVVPLQGAEIRVFYTVMVWGFSTCYAVERCLFIQISNLLRQEFIIYSFATHVCGFV